MPFFTPLYEHVPLLTSGLEMLIDLLHKKLVITSETNTNLKQRSQITKKQKRSKIRQIQQFRTSLSVFCFFFTKFGDFWVDENSYRIQYHSLCYPNKTEGRDEKVLNTA